MKKISGTTVPDSLTAGILLYAFLPDPEIPASFTMERGMRNVGFLTKSLMSSISKKHIGVAGGGGIGSPVWEGLLRLVVGHLRLADSGYFDVSNIHRQMGATMATVGKSKMLETIRWMRTIAADTEIWGYAGISPDTVDHFLSGLDDAVDSIEYQAIGARHLFNLRARELGVPVWNGNSVGFGTNLFRFDPEGAWLGDAWPHEMAASYELERECLAGTISKERYAYLCDCIDLVFLPEIRNYGSAAYDTRRAFNERLRQQKIASIVSPNPKMAAGILLDRLVVWYGQHEGLYENVASLPAFPEYLHFDAAVWTAERRILDIKKIRHELSLRMPR